MNRAAAPGFGRHLREAFAWSGETPIEGRAILIAVLGMAVPVVVGLLAGRAEQGFTIGLGAMLLAGGPAAAGAAGTAEPDRPAPAGAVPPALLAVTMATFVARLPGGDAAMIALAGAAATLAGYSRPVAIAAIRFIVYFVLSLTLLQAAGGHRGEAALVFGLGALWNVAVRLLLARPRAAAPAAVGGRVPTTAQRRAHWRRTMRTLGGWQFPLRLMIGLAVASLSRAAWPDHHFGWIVLTVALLTQRPLEHVPVKIVQRAIGTLGGVALTWAILAAAPAAGIHALPLAALVVCLLAPAAAIARTRSYLAYAMLSTPVILLVLDLGRTIEPGLLTDRLIATLGGAAIVVALNLALDRAMRGRRKTEG